MKEKMTHKNSNSVITAVAIKMNILTIKAFHVHIVQEIIDEQDLNQNCIKQKFISFNWELPVKDLLVD